MQKRTIKEPEQYQIPSPGFVRAFAVLLFLVDFTVIVLTFINFTAIGSSAYLLLAGAFGSVFCIYKAFKTGDPSWILLDLIIR